MTTVAFNGKILAADSLVIAGSHICDTQAQKIFMGERGIAAWTGAQGIGMKLVQWLMAGKPDSDLKFPVRDELVAYALWIPTRGPIEIYDSRDYHTIDKLPRIPYAQGYGSEYALGAMLAGADPINAVRIASMCETSTGGDFIQYIEIFEPEDENSDRTFSKPREEEFKIQMDKNWVYY